MLADLRFHLARRRYLERRAYNPNQPRVPAGNRDGGQWTDGEGGGGRVRLASSDKPKLGRFAVGIIAAEIAKRLIDNYRSENNLRDLFGRDDGTVTVTTIDGKDVFGSNSTSPTYTAQDREAATAMRDRLVQKYPDDMNTQDVGRMPNNALFHAESTVLLRAARENGGTLVGRTLEVFSDRSMCNNCGKALPYLVRELGNPTVNFVGPGGYRATLRNGNWVK